MELFFLLLFIVGVVALFIFESIFYAFFKSMEGIILKLKISNSKKDTLIILAKFFCGALVVLTLVVIVLIIQEVDPDVWMILGGIIFLFLFIFSTVGGLFIGEIPFIGFATESKIGCFLTVIIFILILVFIVFSINS